MQTEKAIATTYNVTNVGLLCLLMYLPYVMLQFSYPTGTIFDATGSYTVSFIIAGSFIAFSGAICLPLRRISQWENSKQPEMDAEYHMVAADEFNLPLPAPDGTDSKGTLSGSGKEVRFVTDVNPDIHNEGSSD